MSEGNKALIQRIIDEVFNGHDPTAAEGLIAEDVVDHSVVPGQPSGLRGMQRRWETFFKAFPDLSIDIVHLVAEGDLVALHSVGRGTHDGEFFGIPPTGRHVTFQETNISRIKDGLMVEHWATRDSFGLMQQLGVVSA